MNPIFVRIGVIVFGIAVVSAIMALIVWGTSLPSFRIWKFSVMLLPMLALLVVFAMARDKLQALFYSLIVTLPVLGLSLPPKRWEISVFDALSAVLVVILLVRQLTGRNNNIRFVEPYWLFGLLVVVASTIFGIDPRVSSVELLRMTALYLVFIVAIYYLRDPVKRELVELQMAGALILVSLFVGLEYITGINFSFSSLNLNAISYSGGTLIRRSGGFFQDPQKAGQFMAVLMVYFTALWASDVFRERWKSRLLLVAIIAAACGLLLTVSRLAITAGFLLSIMAYIVTANNKVVQRFAVVTILIIVVILISIVIPNTDLGEKLLPESVTMRFKNVDEGRSVRMMIWENSWHIFTDNPVIGIGPGNYQEQLMLDEPKLRDVIKYGGFVPSQPESGYLKVLYETGAFGACWLAVVIMLSVIRCMLVLFGRQPKEERSRAWAVLFGGAAFLITYATLFTTSDARNLMLAVFLVAIGLRKKVLGGSFNSVSTRESGYT